MELRPIDVLSNDPSRQPARSWSVCARCGATVPSAGLAQHACEPDEVARHEASREFPPLVQRARAQGPTTVHLWPAFCEWWENDPRGRFEEYYARRQRGASS